MVTHIVMRTKAMNGRKPRNRRILRRMSSVSTLNRISSQAPGPRNGSRGISMTCECDRVTIQLLVDCETVGFLRVHKMAVRGWGLIGQRTAWSGLQLTSHGVRDRLWFRISWSAVSSGRCESPPRHFHRKIVPEFPSLGLPICLVHFLLSTVSDRDECSRACNQLE